MYIEQARAITSPDDFGATVPIGWAAGLVASARGEHDEAVAALDEALRTVRQTDYLNFTAETLRIRGQILWAAGRTDEAASSFDEAAALWEHKGNVADLARLARWRQRRRPAMTGRYPPIEPYERGMLEVGDGNAVYWETCGDPNGKPAVVVHGGPGSGCAPWQRELFDPRAYRIVLFDQRGCGRSTPHASEPAIDLATNTTQHLIADMELLRAHLDIDRWLVFGGSWGSTLSLAYAEAHPGRVTEMVLWGVTTGRRSEDDWWFRGGVAPLFPEQWERLARGVAAGRSRRGRRRRLREAAAVIRTPRSADARRSPGAHGSPRRSHGLRPPSSTIATRTRTSRWRSPGW